MNVLKLLKILINQDGSAQDFCCYGYLIDFIETLSIQLSFEYELYLVPDGLYGDMVKKLNSFLMILI
jgi:hypothetical protein